MRYQANLTINSTSVLELLKPEIKRFESPRSRIRISKKGGNAVVDFEAEDATALRASIDSVVQLLKVFEKMDESR